MVDNIPILKDSCGNLICTVINTIETTTHTIFVAEVNQMMNYKNKIPMTYRYYHEVLKGKSPKNAPTFIEENKKNIWKCDVCGYEVEKDSLPDDFICPICGETKNSFKKIN